MNLTQTIEQSVKTVLSVNQPEIDIQASLKDDYGMTSMKLVMLVSSLSEELKVGIDRLSEQEIFGIQTAQDLIDMFAPKLAEN